MTRSQATLPIKYSIGKPDQQDFTLNVEVYTHDSIRNDEMFQNDKKSRVRLHLPDEDIDFVYFIAHMAATRKMAVKDVILMLIQYLKDVADDNTYPRFRSAEEEKQMGIEELLDNIIEGNFLPSETLWSWRNSTGRI
jgi:hypothetical protein